MKLIEWEIEDTFFGAFLGALLGILVDKLPLIHIVLLISFFVLLPSILRKADQYSKHVLVAANVGSIIWIILFIVELNNKDIEIFEEGGVILGIIFTGWLISKNIKFASIR